MPTETPDSKHLDQRQDLLLEAVAALVRAALEAEFDGNAVGKLYADPRPGPELADDDLPALCIWRMRQKWYRRNSTQRARIVTIAFEYTLPSSNTDDERGPRWPMLEAVSDVIVNVVCDGSHDDVYEGADVLEAAGVITVDEDSPDFRYDLVPGGREADARQFPRRPHFLGTITLEQVPEEVDTDDLDRFLSFHASYDLVQTDDSGETPSQPGVSDGEGPVETNLPAFGTDTDLTVDAGTDFDIDVGEAAALNAPGASGGTAPYSYEWDKLSGPGPVDFGDTTSLTSSLALRSVGAHQLRLRATGILGSVAEDLVQVSLVTAADPELLAIFGALYWGDWDARALGTIDGSNGVASWPSPLVTAGDLAAASESVRPLFGATSFNGGPGVTGDGVNDYLVATLASAIPAGQRPYLLTVGQFISAPAGIAAFAMMAHNTTIPWLYAGQTNTHSNWIQSRHDSSGNSIQDTGIARDNNRHLIEQGFTAGGVDSFVIDGTAVNHTRNGTTTDTVTRVSLFAGTGGNVASNFRAARHILLSDAPTAQQLADVRAYLRGANFPGYASDSYGLP